MMPRLPRRSSSSTSLSHRFPPRQCRWPPLPMSHGHLLRCLRVSPGAYRLVKFNKAGNAAGAQDFILLMRTSRQWALPG